MRTIRANNFLAEAQSRLHEYAAWLVRNEAAASGYPPGRTSVEYRMMSGMARSTQRSDGLMYYKMPARVRDIDRLVSSMEDRLRWPIWVKYVSPRYALGDTGILTDGFRLEHWAANPRPPLRKMSVSNLKRLILLAEHYVAGYLEANR